jgi:hypothetical protein
MTEPSTMSGVLGIALVLAITAILGLLAEWYWEKS